MKYCKHTDCKKRPNFGLPNSKLAEFCKEHSPANYVDVKHKRCQYIDCKKRPNFGLPNSKLAEFCKEHSPANYVDVKNKRCKHTDCKKRPIYGLPNSKIAEFCKEHSPANYINVKDKRCQYIDCKKRPIYGLPNSKLAEFCKEHSPANYVDVKNKRCKHTDCKKIPIYGLPNSKLAEFCKEHSPANYVDVKNKRCKHTDCKKIPNFGLPNSKLAEFCKEHSPANYVDVKHKRCQYIDCHIRASYGLLFKEKTHCARHKKNNEFKKNNPKCTDCKEMPIYTDKKDNYPLRCEKHFINGDVNIIESECSSCHLSYYISEGNMCNDCNTHRIRKYEHKKEIEIKQMLDENNIKYDSHDKIVKDSCLKYRPDFVIDCLTHFIIIEVDENQHKSYQHECEQARMINLSQGFGGAPVIFIRYNPDSYKNHLKKYSRVGKKTRFNRLLHCIKSYMIYKPNALLSIIYLYYDGDNNVNNIKELLKFEEIC
jgi:very-short-patch-repair endonuclease